MTSKLPTLDQGDLAALLEVLRNVRARNEKAPQEDGFFPRSIVVNEQLTMLVDLPLVGEYFTDAQSYVTEYAETTNYKEDFDQMNQQLREINEGLKKEAGSASKVQE